GDDRKAIAVYRAFLDDPEFLRRESAETLINIEASLAALLYGQGDFAEAQRAIERAMLRARTVLVPNHPTQIENEIIAASILLERGDKAGALALAEPALAKARVAFGPDHVLVGTCLRRFAQVLIASERVDEGVAAVEQAIRIFDQRLGRRSGRSIDARSQLAEAYRRKNELERSAKLYAELLADAEAAYGAAHPMWAQLSSEHATVLAALDRADEARALLERAIPLLADGPPDLLASAKFELAKLVEADDHGRAITLASEAEVALGALPSTADKHATVRTWLARHVRRAIAR
ncbi:MAG TPA: tetratricopeptide repeat protein, partial [Kofleriaceae bacterium]|nr:tetratricopeptide repeat protein [Kofleriaceae bacterium]